MTTRAIPAAGVLALAAACALPGSASAQRDSAEIAAQEQAKASLWTFAVSGDSRNCGDVVMPAVAAGVKKSGASFYWHLGDLRAIYDFDEDILHQPAYRAKRPAISDYETLAWDDFILSQINAFDGIPFFLGIGNHETIAPKSREEFIIQFADWLDSPVLRGQRLADDANDHKLKAHYHWIRGAVDFIYLDNATEDQFDAAQVSWFEKVLQADASNSGIRTIVVGMHEALPESISKDHSMNQSTEGTVSGRRVYRDLLEVQNTAHKHVYVIASHSHYFMAGIFNTEYWRTNGGVLAGWIVGAAGAVRYKLPPGKSDASGAETNVYGFLLGSVKSDGGIEFKFQPVNEPDVPASVVERYTPQFVHWCFAENSIAR